MFYEFLHMGSPVLADQQKLTFNVDTGCFLEDLLSVLADRGG